MFEGRVGEGERGGGNEGEWGGGGRLLSISRSSRIM